MPMFFLGQLESFNVRQSVMINFYKSVIEICMTSSNNGVIWRYIRQGYQEVQWRCQERFLLNRFHTGTPGVNLDQTSFETNMHDNKRPLSHNTSLLHIPLTSGRRLKSITGKTECFDNSFILKQCSRRMGIPNNATSYQNF